MKLLILGASGFVGRNLVDHFSKFDSIQLFTPKIDELNLLDENSVQAYLSNNYFDVVVNAAVYNPKIDPYSPVPELEQDLRMFYNLERCCELFGKMYYFGSGAEFDKAKDIISAKEETYVNGVPKNQYGMAKYTIGKIIRNSKNIYNLRIFGLFGKYENWKTTFISGACCKAMKGLPITIRQNVFFDYVYIDDFVKIIEWFVFNEPKYHEYNISSGKKISLLDLANIVNMVSNNNVPIVVCQDGLANEYTASNYRLLEEIGGFQFTSFEVAISMLYKYYLGISETIDLLSLLY